MGIFDKLFGKKTRVESEPKKESVHITVSIITMKGM